MSTSTAPRVGTTSIQLLYLFLAFQLVDQTFLPILIATFVFSKSVKRHPTVVNACVTWIITGFICSLLWYAGKHVGPEPYTMLCVSQASLLNGVMPMNSVSVLALLFQVNLSIRRPKAEQSGIRTYMLLVTPYVTFFGFSSGAAFVAVQRPDTVTRARRFFYCSFSTPISNVSAIFSGIALFTALGYAVSLGVFIRNSWRVLRHDPNIDLPFLARVTGFLTYIFLCLILSLLSIFAPHSPFPDLFAASVGTALFLFLSTQRDVWRAWLRLPKPVAPPITEDRIMRDSMTPDLDFDFKDKGNSDADDLDAKASLEGSNPHDLDIENMAYAHELDLQRSGLCSAKEAAGTMPNSAPLIPENRPQYLWLPLVGNTGDSEAGPDSGPVVGMDVVSSYRFARPGMI